VLPLSRATVTTARMDEKTVRHVAKLARLSLDDAEVKRFASDMARITEYVSQLQQVDVGDAEMTVHPVSDHNRWREDEPKPCLKREEAVANAPDSEQNFFKVPPVIE
jgi:aspartyl-tRNA(Asn)/glutamyl-tRNA(Gln) amidotransferase subunit C